MVGDGFGGGGGGGGAGAEPKNHSPKISPSSSGAKNAKRPGDKSSCPNPHPGH